MCCILWAARKFQFVVNQVLGSQSSYSTPIYILLHRLVCHFPILKNYSTANSRLVLQSAIARDLNSVDSHFEVCGFRTRCQGLNGLLGCNVGYIGMFVRNDGALMAVKKLYIYLCAVRDTHLPPCRRFVCIASQKTRREIFLALPRGDSFLAGSKVELKGSCCKIFLQSSTVSPRPSRLELSPLRTIFLCYSW
jgi:hypothetical protein